MPRESTRKHGFKNRYDQIIKKALCFQVLLVLGQFWPDQEPIKPENRVALVQSKKHSGSIFKTMPGRVLVAQYN